MARIIMTFSTPLFFFLLSILFHQTMSQPEHMSTFCNPVENFTQTSSYEANRDILLSSLRTRSLLGTYSNVTVGRSPNTVHGMFLCTGDTTVATCSDCVQTATTEIATNCSLNKGAYIYYEECMVRYSSVSFFSVLEVRPNIVLYSLRSAPDSNTFNETLADKFNELILNVSNPPPPPPALFVPPPTISQPPPPLRPQDVPSPSGSFSFNVIKGKEIFGRIAITMAALVFTLVDL
ncbi:hypothetical protein HID58_060365 [Brassica napus]|uniref:Gnk2-homologous domain-containing protein n=1 Tax=Brassica napus TaxID=3708 RepID=A0ABQ7ZVI2_BRANA|nr:hypothetical protein HID58_060365 [Brassica napus]